MFDPEQIKALSAPLDRSHIKEREQAGRTLSYIEGWHAIAEANRIFGFDGWMRETVGLTCVREPELVDGKYRSAYICKVRIQVGAVVREGTGYGSGIDRDKGSSIESAVKEAETDAMKRALMTFGNPFGLALYDKTHANVCDPARQEVPEIDARPSFDEGILREYMDAINNWTGTAETLKLWWASEESVRKEAGIINGSKDPQQQAAYTQLFKALVAKGKSITAEKEAA